MMIADHAS